jgi:hypothetical protein
MLLAVAERAHLRCKRQVMEPMHVIARLSSAAYVLVAATVLLFQLRTSVLAVLLHSYRCCKT